MWSAPATTCALDITLFADTTKPLPSSSLPQPLATALILTTLGCTAATTGLLDNAASGGSTGMMGGRTGQTSGSPDVFSSADNLVGTSCIQPGAHSDTSARIFEFLTALASACWSEFVSGEASSHAATKTAITCTTTPTTESAARSAWLRIAPRTA